MTTKTILIFLFFIICIFNNSLGYFDQLNDYNPYDVNIPDNGSGVNSDLNLSGAPLDAEISEVDLYFEIQHSRHNDLTIWLTAYYDDSWHDHMIYEEGDLSSSGLLKININDIHSWDGASPNQTWYLSARDGATGETGYINFFELWVTYEVNESPNEPFSPEPIHEETNVSISTNLNWSCSDPNGDAVYYTVYFEKGDSSPNDIIKNDGTGSDADLGTLDYESTYYWKVKADDHKGGISWSPVWEFVTEVEPVINAEITNVTFDKTSVIAGQETITATITILNTGNQGGTFWVGGSSIQENDVDWWNWIPSRKDITLSPNTSGLVQLQWSPDREVPIGFYGFYCKIFEDIGGDEFFDENWFENSFEVLEDDIILKGRIAFHRDSDNLSLHPPTHPDDGQIFFFDLKNDITPTNVTENFNSIGNAMNPHFSPDGSKLVFMAIETGNNLNWDSMNVFLLDLAEETDLKPLGQGQDPKFSPDGSKIVFKRNRQIWTMNSDGTNSDFLTTTEDEKSGPNYSPDPTGTEIVYWSNSSSQADIWKMSSSGINLEPIISTDDLQEYYPIYRDVDNILYARWESLSDPHDKIFNYSIIDQTSKKLGSNQEGVEDADPFPIGEVIGYSSTRNSNYNIFYTFSVGSKNAEEIVSTSSNLHELGGVYSRFSYARKLVLISPTEMESLISKSNYLLKVKAFSNGEIWTNAIPSVTFQGSTTYIFSELNDDGLSGDEIANDGIYSKFVELPSIVGNYEVIAEAISLDNGFSNNIKSDEINVELLDGTLETLKLNTKVFLEGPFTNGVMSTNLDSQIPLSQPFSGSTWNHSGSESVAEMPTNVVDWVLVELRTNINTSSDVKRAALLLNTGAVVDLDGSSPVSFTAPSNDYYIVIYQRNHLAVMSSDLVKIGSGAYKALFSSTVPIINGEINDSEWVNSNSYGITFSRNDGVDTKPGTLYLQHDGTWLFIGVKTQIDCGWDVYLSLKFDGNNNHLLDGNSSEPHTDVNVQRGCPSAWSGHSRYDYLVSSNTYPTTAPIGTVQTSYGSSNVNYEFKIKISDFDVNPDQTIGFYMFGKINGLVEHSYEFPINAVGTIPSEWEHIELQ